MPRAVSVGSQPHRAPLSRLAALVAGGLLTLAGPALPAAAHDEMTGSTPADGSTVEVPPATVELTFSEPPLPLGSQVQVTGPDGEVVNDGDLAITDTVVSQPLAADLPAGDYTVAWRVTSSDGHPISGELGFTAQGTTAATEPAATPTTDPTAAPSTQAPAEPTEEPTEEATTEPGSGSDDGAAASDAQDADDRSGAAPWVVGAVVVLLVGGTLWWVVRRRAGGASHA